MTNNGRSTGRRAPPEMSRGRADRRPVRHSGTGRQAGAPLSDAAAACGLPARFRGPVVSRPSFPVSAAAPSAEHEQHDPRAVRCKLQCRLRLCSLHSPRKECSFRTFFGCHVGTSRSNEDVSVFAWLNKLLPITFCQMF